MGQGLLVLKACEMRDNGASIDENGTMASRKKIKEK